MNQLYIRIIGSDATGKTTICKELEALNDNIVTFHKTPAYVYRWLRTYGIGSSSSITHNQVAQREHIFKRFNEHEVCVLNDVLVDKPVAAVRGRADTLITHAALRGQIMPRDINKLFPRGMKPDLLVVLTASLAEIEARLDARGQAKTGANSMQFHEICGNHYLDVATIARKHMNVMVLNSSESVGTPRAIASQILAAI